MRLRRPPCALLVACLLVSAVRAVSPESRRIEGTFTLVYTNLDRTTTPTAGNLCPQTVQYLRVGTYENINPAQLGQDFDAVRWRDMRINGAPCLRTATRATATVLQTPAASFAPDTPPEVANWWFVRGVDNAPRECGQYSATREAVHFFSDDIPRFRDRLVDEGILPAAVPELDSATKGTIYMFSRQFAGEGIAASKTVCVMVLPTPSPSPSPSPSPNQSDGGGRPCFPRDALVRLADGRTRAMEELDVGDIVDVGGGLVSAVVLFGHRTANVRSRFVELLTEGNASVSLSEGHYVRVGDGKLMRAGEVRVGDFVRVPSGKERIRRVRSVWGSGLYSPVTAHGDVVVGGVVASCYTDALDPMLAHAAMAPLRLVFLQLGWVTRLLESGFGSLPPGIADALGRVRGYRI